PAEDQLDPIARPPAGRDPKESGDEERSQVATGADREPLSDAAGANAPPLASLDHARALRELRELWRRGWASDDSPKAQAIAPQALDRACREVDPVEIIEATTTWVAAADAPRFLPVLPQWLAAKGWEKPPPVKARKRAPAHGSQSGRNGYAKPDMFKIAL